jgi:hypothetical protein
MKHFENHVEDAQASLNAAMERAGVSSPVLVLWAFESGRHEEPHGLLAQGTDAATVDRAALWLKAWGAKHGFITRDGGRVKTAEETRKRPTMWGYREGESAFVVFDVRPYD